MGTGGCVIIKRRGKDDMTRYVSHDGYPSGFGSVIATYLLGKDSLLHLFEYLLYTSYSEDYKGAGETCTYEVDMDAKTVTVSEESDGGSLIRRTLSFEEFDTWCVR